MQTKGLVVIAIALITISLVWNTAYTHTLEAKKSKQYTVNVYFYDWCCGKVSKLHIWLIDDNDDRFTSIKNIDFNTVTSHAKGSLVKATSIKVNNKSPTLPGQTGVCVAPF